MIRRSHIFFVGQVQGVGFRYTASQLAARFQLSGWVRNLTDGRVEMIVEGLSDTVDDFVQSLIETTHGNVTDLTRSQVRIEDQIDGFEIRPTATNHR